MKSTFRKSICIAALLFTAGSLSGLGPQVARAVDPVPDYWTFIIPSLVPKAGQTGTFEQGIEALIVDPQLPNALGGIVTDSMTGTVGW